MVKRLCETFVRYLRSCEMIFRYLHTFCCYCSIIITAGSVKNNTGMTKRGESTTSMPMHHTPDRNLNTLSNVTKTTCTTKNSNMTAMQCNATTMQGQPRHRHFEQQQRDTSTTKQHKHTSTYTQFEPNPTPRNSKDRCAPFH